MNGLRAPSDAEIRRAMEETGFDRMQAIRSIQRREQRALDQRRGTR